MTNATIDFDYEVETSTGNSPVSDSISRAYTFNIDKTASSGVTTTPDTAHYHVKGVKLLHVHTIPSKVVVGNTFSLQGIVFNNSTATITFANGTCTAPSSSLSIRFNGNVMTDIKAAATSCKSQQVTLKRGEQSGIQSPILSSMAYKSTAPGITYATMIFKYGVETVTNKSPISDNISRVYTFNIQAGSQPAGASSCTTANSEPSPLKLPTP
jgi:hypothetical protein